MEDSPHTPEQLSPVKKALLEIRELRARLKEAERVRNEPIAIIGMGCRFPGGANDPESLWRVLTSATDAIREVPRDRWDVNEFFDPDSEAAGKMSTRWGGFLGAVDQFDPDFFGISPREAVGIDPQQRLFLEVCWEALENAGQAPEKLAGSLTGVFLGIASNDYAQLQMQFGTPAQIDAYFATGTCHSVAAGRVAYTLGLQGPAVALDTACSSSLVAVHMACQSLRLGECRMALAGGVNVILAPELLINFSRSHMMAADGRCKTFDASADGFVRGEGCGVVALKRLSDAQADADNILAVIRGTAVNQDGRSSGLTVPNGSSQQEVIRAALRNGGVSPHEMGYVETHGTGTALGDPIEVHALNAVYGEGRDRDTPLALGSIKANIGHLETAAGVAGLIKTVLVLMHGEIPPQLHFRTPNPHIAWEETAIEIPTQLRPWPSRGKRRVAAVSSFGFSGTNAHIVVGEYSQPAASAEPSRERGHEVLALSGKSESAVRELAGRYASHVERHGEQRLAEICQTGNRGRSHFEHRVAVVAGSSGQLAERLRAASSGEDAVGVLAGQADLTRRPEVAFLFTGQGGQYAGMGRGLYETEPVFRAVVDRCDELLRPHLEQSLIEVLYPKAGAATPLDETAYTHPAMFAVQYGLFALWRSWGVEPGLVMGHSVGEIVAATASGMVSLEDGLLLMRERGRLMQSLPRVGMMASLLAGEAAVEAALEGYGERVSIAALNGPESTVISGERSGVEAVLRKLESQGVKTRVLKVSNSFHSPLVEPVLEEFERVARGVEYRAPQIAQYSSMRLGWVREGELLDAAYWRYNLRHTVRFHQAVAGLYEQGYRVFVEIGPTPILVSMGAQCVPAGESLWLASLRPDQPDTAQMAETLAQLYVRGTPIDWNQFHQGYSRRPIALPTYPFQRRQYRLESTRTRQREYSGQNARWQDALHAATTQAGQIPVDLRLDSYATKWRALDRLTAACITHTFVALGAFRVAGETHTLDSLLSEFGILPAYRPLLARWLKTLSAEGMVFETEGVWRASVGLVDDLESACRVAAEELQDVPFLIEYMRRCGEMAPAILRGEASAVDTLFQGGSFDLAENIYQHWALSRYFNGMIGSVVASLVRTLPHGRELRVLEIGAGIGSSAASVLPVLPADRGIYCFTDVSKFFFDHAREKFKSYPSLRFALLDIEKDPAMQGFGEHAFDVVVACNVLHATRDLDDTIRNAARLLRPAGVLLLCEVTNPQSWIEFSYGLMPDWYRFHDRLRQESPLLAREDWETLLGAHGFEDVVSFPEAGSPAAILGEHCIVARVPSSTRASGDDSTTAWAIEALPEAAAAPAVAVSSQSTDSHAAAFLHRLRESAPGEQREQLVEFVQNHVMKVLRRDATEPIGSRQRLMDLGIDSLMAVELRNALSRDLKLAHPLSATLIFDYPNVEAIAEYLASRVLALDSVSSHEQSVDGQRNIPGQSIRTQPAPSSVESLSDEEVEKLLIEKLETM